MNGGLSSVWRARARGQRKPRVQRCLAVAEAQYSRGVAGLQRSH